MGGCRARIRLSCLRGWRSGAVRLSCIWHRGHAHIRRTRSRRSRRRLSVTTPRRRRRSRRRGGGRERLQRRSTDRTSLRGSASAASDDESDDGDSTAVSHNEWFKVVGYCFG